MLKTRVAVGVVAASAAGGFAAYKFFKNRLANPTAPTEPPVDNIPNEISEAAPQVIYREEPTPVPKPKPRSLVDNLKSATETVKSAFKLTIIAGQGLVISSLTALAIAVKALTATPPGETTNNAPLKPRWLISRNDDLIYLIGSVAVSYAFMFGTFKLNIEPMLIWWLWALILDGPHVWGTATRTYFDKQERQHRGKLLLGSLGWFGVGTLWAALHIETFRLFALTWAYYHLVKQHYGFMILYKKKNNDLAKFDNFVDKTLVWVGFGYPFFNSMFKKDGPDTMRGVGALIPHQAHPAIRESLRGAFLAALGLYASRQVYKLPNHLPLNTPKHLLLAAAIGLHLTVGALPYGQVKNGLMLIVATLTAYHNVQYQRLMWFHNRNKYGRGDFDENRKTYGLATYFGRNFWVYLGSGIIFTLFYRPVLTGSLRKGRFANALEGFFWGFAFLHYYLDSKIWRVRSDKKLNQALKMENRPATA